MSTVYAPKERQYPQPTHTLLHLSDLHFVENRRPLYGVVDCDSNLEEFLSRFCDTGIQVDAIVVTGDLADNGTPDSYQRLRRTICGAATRLECEVAWVMGNHDNRRNFRSELLGGASDNPVYSVMDLNGLRLVILDSTVPGFHHGELDETQLTWLTRTLETPAQHGTILALHHPPIPTELDLLQLVELRDSASLSDRVQEGDVRAIIAGHFHYSTASMLGSVPVYTAAATCYTQDVVTETGTSRAQDGGQGASLIHVYPDRIVSSCVSLTAFDSVYRITPEDSARILAGNGPDLLGS